MESAKAIAIAKPFLFFLALPRKRPATSETARQLLNAFDSAEPQDLEALRQTLTRLQETLLASRDQLEQHLRLYPEDLLQEAWGQARQARPVKETHEAKQLPLVLPMDSSPAKPHTADNGSAFQSAERPGEYRVLRPVTIDEVYEFIRQELERKFFRENVFKCPEETKRYLIARLAREEQEVFATLFLDNRHRLLAFEKLFYGTIDGCSVHPREVVKRTIQLNAAAVVFGHNHPSGEPEPSMADRSLTDRLKQALALVDVRVLDHIVIGGTEAVSFAERGMV